MALVFGAVLTPEFNGETNIFSHCCFVFIVITRGCCDGAAAYTEQRRGLWENRSTRPA